MASAAVAATSLEDMKPIIHQMHKDGLSILEMQDRLLKDHNFYTSFSQLRRWLTEWNIYQTSPRFNTTQIHPDQRARRVRRGASRPDARRRGPMPNATVPSYQLADHPDVVQQASHGFSDNSWFVDPSTCAPASYTYPSNYSQDLNPDLVGIGSTPPSNIEPRGPILGFEDLPMSNQPGSTFHHNSNVTPPQYLPLPGKQFPDLPSELSMDDAPFVDHTIGVATEEDQMMHLERVPVPETDRSVDLEARSESERHSQNGSGAMEIDTSNYMSPDIQLDTPNCMTPDIQPAELTATVQGFLPQPGRVRHPLHSRGTWTRIKPKFTHLFFELGMPLRDVMWKLSEEYGVRAT